MCITKGDTMSNHPCSADCDDRPSSVHNPAHVKGSELALGELDKSDLSKFQGVEIPMGPDPVTGHVVDPRRELIISRSSVGSDDNDRENEQ